MEKKRRRIELFDIIKCIAIFMVIWGHTATNEELTGSPPLLYIIIYSIHMPLFFFLSGLSSSLKPLKGWGEWKLFLRKSILTLVFPYLIWALIYCNFNFTNVGWILYGSWQALGKAGTLTSLWYLASLFVARIYVRLIVSLMSKLEWAEKRLWYLIPAAVLMVVSAILPKISIGYPWCMDNALAAAGCILMGMALKDEIVKLSVQKGILLSGILAGCAALYVVIVVLLGDRFVMNFMCKTQFGEPIPALLLALLGGMAIIAAAMLLKRLFDEHITRFSLHCMTYIGQHTLGIFLLHKPMMQQVFIPILENLMGSFFPEAGIRFIGAWVSLFASILLCRVIEHYVPELVGIFSRDLIAGKSKASAKG